MSTTIDERIVKMTFENKNFESGIASSLSWLDKLKNSLKFKNSTTGLEDVAKSVDKLNSNGMDGLSRGVETVTHKFSALGVVATTALVNITNSAVNAGKNLVNSLTLEPITSGFTEYEQKMTAIQTILTNTASKGTTLKDVTAALDELNKYADQTIYNFGEMTKNIGTFTAAGIDLETSVKAIKGISNLGAGSGSSPAQVATAMYQLSQALASGVVNLADWNSVVNAGMGGELFQNALKKTAKEMGKVIDETQTFRESISTKDGTGWLTSDVLIKTLEQFADDKMLLQAATEVKTLTGLIDTMKESVQSGWAVSWEHILGDKNQAAKLFTSLSNGFNSIVEPISNARNEALKFWNETGGRDDVLKGLSNILTSVGKGLKAVGEAFREVFPAITGKQLVDISAKFKELTNHFKMNDAVAGKIKNTFKGVFSVINLLKNAVVTLFSALTPLTGIFAVVGDGALTITSYFGQFVSSLNDAAKKTNFFDNIGKGITKVLSSIGYAFANVDKLIGGFFNSISKLNFEPIFKSFGDAATLLSTGLTGLFQGIGKALGTIDFNTIFKAINTAIGGGALVLLKDFIESFGGVTSDLSSTFKTIKGTFKNVTETLDAVRESLTAYQNNLNAGTLFKISAAIGILAAALLTLSTIEPEKLDSALTGVTVLFIELIGAMALMMKVCAGTKFKGFLQIPTLFISMSVAVLILAGAVKQLGELSWEEIAKGLSGVLGLLTMFVLVSKTMSSAPKGIIKMSASLILLSAAINSMATAVGKFGNMDTNKLIKGISAIGGILLEMAIFSKLGAANNVGLKNSAGILMLSLALNTLAIAVSSFGNMKGDAMGQGLAGVGIILTEVAMFSKFTSNSGKLIATATGLVILGGALHIMSSAVSSMGNIPWQTLAIGLGGIAGALIVISGAARLLPKGLIKDAVGLAAMAGALHVVASALDKLGTRSWEELGMGLAAMAGSLIILAGAMKLMSTGLSGAAAMLVMSGALALFVPQLLLLSTLSLEQLGIGLLAIAGAFTVLGVAGLALTPVIPSLFALAGVIATLALSAVAVAGSLGLFATSLGLLATVGVAGGLAFVEVLRQMINLLPQFGKKLGEGFVTFAEAIGNNMPVLLTAVATMISGILEGFTMAIPKIVEAAIKLIEAFLTAIGEALPKLINIGVDIILKVCTGILENLEKIGSAAVSLIVAFIDFVSKNLGSIIDAGIKLAISFINGVANGIRDNGDILDQAIRNLIDAIIGTAVKIFVGAVSQFVKCGVNLIVGLYNGIKSYVSPVVTFVGTLPGKMATAIGQKVSSMYNTGVNLIKGLINGIKAKATEAVNAAKGVVQSAIDAAKKLLGIHSPSRVFGEIGKFTVLGFTNSLTNLKDTVIKPAGDLAQTAIDAVGNPLSKIADVLTADIDSTPVIKPVIDLSNVKNGAKTITELMSESKNLSLGTNTSGILSTTIGKIQNGIDNSEVVSAINDLKGVLSNSTGTSYNINGITYNEGGNIGEAIKTLIHATTIERRV